MTVRRSSQKAQTHVKSYQHCTCRELHMSALPTWQSPMVMLPSRPSDRGSRQRLTMGHRHVSKAAICSSPQVYRYIESSAHLEIGDEVLKVMQLEQSRFTLRHDGHGNPKQDLGPVFRQQDVYDPSCKGGWEWTAEEGEEPLGCIEYWGSSMRLPQPRTTQLLRTSHLLQHCWRRKSLALLGATSATGALPHVL